MSTFRPGGILSGQTFKLDQSEFTYKNAYGKWANVPRLAIQTATVTPLKGGKANLLIVGSGTTLATIELPAHWAKKTQKWLLKELGK
ncbi:MAG: hypothetical protein HGA39_05865 [Coriobacteriia bacterium]|nr:hypothetical protein [Coriobacteriia bacterium]